MFLLVCGVSRCEREEFFAEKYAPRRFFIRRNTPSTWCQRSLRSRMSHMSDLVVDGSTSHDAKNNPAAPKQSIFLYTLLALGLALFVRFYVAAPYVVSGASMEPNFDNWHYLIVDRLSFRFGEPQRGEVIVFNLPQELSRSLIKRVIGLPGETVVLKGKNVSIINAKHPDGFTLDEPYLDPANVTGTDSMRVELAKDQFFVLGDNRRVSADSRLWGILPREDMVGRAVLRLYPFNLIGILPENATYANE